MFSYVEDFLAIFCVGLNVEAVVPEVSETDQIPCCLGCVDGRLYVDHRSLWEYDGGWSVAFLELMFSHDGCNSPL